MPERHFFFDLLHTNLPSVGEIERTYALEHAPAVTRHSFPGWTDGSQLPPASWYDAAAAGLAVQLLLGHTKIESTVRHLGVEIDDAIERGFPVVGEAWYGLWAPAKVAADRVAELNRVATSALAQEGVVKRLNAIGLIAAPSTSEALTATMRADAATWSPIVKESGFRMEK